MFIILGVVFNGLRRQDAIVEISEGEAAIGLLKYAKAIYFILNKLAENEAICGKEVNSDAIGLIRTVYAAEIYTPTFE